MKKIIITNAIFFFLYLNIVFFQFRKKSITYYAENYNFLR